MRFMGRLYKEPEKGGAWLVGYKIYWLGDRPDMPNTYNDLAEFDSRWKAFSDINSGKAWLHTEMIRITGKKTIEWYESANYVQGDVMFKLEKESINA